MNSTRHNLIKIGLILAFICLFLYFVFLYFSYTVRSRELGENTKVTKIEPDPTITTFDVWEQYVDTEEGFALKYPGYLVKRIILDEGGYKKFIRFEESSFSEGTNQKGVAVGITEKSSTDEINRIKEEMVELGGTPKTEEGYSFNGYSATLLVFDPIDTALAEKRSFIIFSVGEKTYSISTVPEQIENVIESFQEIKVKQ